MTLATIPLSAHFDDLDLNFVEDKTVPAPVVPLTPRPVRPERQRAHAHIATGTWDENPALDPTAGFGAPAGPKPVKPKYEKAARFRDRDVIILDFLTRYKYAWPAQLARLVDTSLESLAVRMKQLEQSGFVRRETFSANRYLWVATKAGCAIIGSPFLPIRKGTISAATIAHTIGLGSLGVELERAMGGKDVLGEQKDDMPAPANRWYLGRRGHEKGLTLGEMTVTERQIRQGQMAFRGEHTNSEMRALQDLVLASEEALELEDGQESLFIVYGTTAKDGEHIPDLVVARERGINNEPQHLAIELELTQKPKEKWRRILRWYRDNGVMYEKIYLFTQSRAIANRVASAAEECGMTDRLVIRKYNPLDKNLPFWG